MLINTIVGRLEPQALGRTLTHEHVFAFAEQGQAVTGKHWDVQAEIDRAVARLEAAKADGIDAIVDLTVPGLGRDIRLVEQVAMRTSVHIVAATGLYEFREIPARMLAAASRRGAVVADYLTELFVTELVDGIDETSIRAGVIKCCTDQYGITAGVETILRAAARAHRATGAPIFTHTNGRHGLDQLAIFGSEGADLTKVVIGHSGARSDFGYLEGITASGASVGMDQFGMNYVPQEKRIRAVAELVRRGYADRIVLSHDYASFTDTFVAPAEWTDYGYSCVPRVVVPELLKSGCEPGDIERMLVANPRRLLTFG